MDVDEQAARDAGDQRTAAWFKMRESRLTASSFTNALGCLPAPSRKP